MHTLGHINMKMYLFISLGIQLLASSCDERIDVNSKQDVNVQTDSSYIGDTIKVLSNTDSLEKVLDTTSLHNFWINFQKDLQRGNKDSIIKVLEYPVRAYYIVLFQFAHNCDTNAFIINERKFSDLDITQANVYEHYNFIFTKLLQFN